MADQRMVGHAIRRRQGNAASHLGQAEGAAKRRGEHHSQNPSGQARMDRWRDPALYEELHGKKED